MPTLDEVRARFGADKPKPQPPKALMTALGLLRQGKCPSCGKPTFSKLLCRTCKFSAQGWDKVDLDETAATLLVPDAETGTPDEEEVKMLRMELSLSSSCP